jgi:hypothetical protein
MKDKANDPSAQAMKNFQTIAKYPPVWRINMRKLLLGTIAILALITQANTAPIAQCILKSYAEVKAVPSARGHVILSAPDELRVDLLEEFGTQWVWIASTNSDNRAVGWVRRSSLKFCLERSPFRK